MDRDLCQTDIDVAIIFAQRMGNQPIHLSNYIEYTQNNGIAYTTLWILGLCVQTKLVYATGSFACTPECLELVYAFRKYTRIHESSILVHRPGFAFVNAHIDFGSILECRNAVYYFMGQFLKRVHTNF